jgi:multidrug resistance protein, MATE family
MASTGLLPGQVLGTDDRPRLDYRAVARLALPLILNSAVQAVLNTTDTWFIGRLSPAATAAMGAVYWPVLVFLWLFGGVGLSVQTVVAHAYGGGRYTRASQATWTALWASLLTVPLFAALAFSGSKIFSPFGVPPETLQLALEYWMPRMLGGPLAVALLSVLGFFNGIGRPMITLQVTLGVALANAALNQLFMFNFGWGMAGSAWASSAAQLLGLVAALLWFLKPELRGRYRSHLTARLKRSALFTQCRLGLPMGVQYAADILAFALFQLMQVRAGTVDGAATQLVMVLTSFCYMPAIGVAMAGTTLVGQAIGSGHRDWAYTVGNNIILQAVAYMTIVGALLAATGPWILPYFTNGSDPRSAEVIARGALLLWIAAGYQVFDGLNIGAGNCLRGAGDALIPSVMGLASSILLFVPLACILSFKPGSGWVPWLPQLGYGAVGGWFAGLTYISLLGLMLLWRWRSQAWRQAVVI